MASRNSNGESYGKGRTRYFATIVYPESAPENWEEILTQFHVPALVSPLHDSDVNPDGEIKKAHYHVLLMFESVKTQEQASEILDSIGGVGRENVASVRGYARYLCHLDNPEKHQYCPDDVRSFSGADYFDTVTLSTDRYACIGEMIDFIDANKIHNYMDLFKYARDNRPDWFRLLCDNCAYVIGQAIKGQTYKDSL